MTDLYSLQDTAHIFGLEVSRLRYWAQTGFVNPSVRRGRRFFYTFQDLVALRTAKELLDAGLSMHKVRKNLESLRALLPEVSHPASRMRIASDGETVVALDRGAAFEPTSGQMVMSFAIDALSTEVAEVVALPTPIVAREVPQIDCEESLVSAPRTTAALEALVSDEHNSEFAPALSDDHLSDGHLSDGHLSDGHLSDNHQLSADDDHADAPDAESFDTYEPAPTSISGYQYFLQACEADDLGDAERAEEFYRIAIEHEPSLAASFTNLGNLLYRRGDLVGARSAYERALELEPAQAEARFDLGNLLEDLGETEQAVAELRRVCWTHPDFADAHYNLALVLARIGGLSQARRHLERYLELEGDVESVWFQRAQTFRDALTGAKLAAAAR